MGSSPEMLVEAMRHCDEYATLLTTMYSAFDRGDRFALVIEAERLMTEVKTCQDATIEERMQSFRKSAAAYGILSAATYHVARNMQDKEHGDE